MSFSKYLSDYKPKLIELQSYLNLHFKYVSILGVDNFGSYYMVDKFNQAVSDTDSTDSGFVIKMTNEDIFYEYSFNEIKGSVKDFANEVLENLKISKDMFNERISHHEISLKEMNKDFERENDLDKFDIKTILESLTNIKDEVLKKSELIKNASVRLDIQDISKIFVSTNRCLTQHYTWVNGNIGVFYFKKKMSHSFVGAYSNLIKEVLDTLPLKIDEVIDKAVMLQDATPIKPGVYYIITAPSITGLIAHEAFGHGVEMDQFVKDRALGKYYMNKEVASKISSMKDGAKSAFSAASYFFDDDGVLAGDTTIIENGILKSGISDLTSASILGTEPTGNGRRESFKRKAYSRMTNTFFLKGDSKLSDMIKSVKHGYMLFNTNNGMEDPKNWQIQCVCEYGIEIIDGKLTKNVVSPVVMSGNVLDLLKSISMISDSLEVIGSGSCGKGYKEWVRVSDGGPALKARVKLS